MTPLEATLRAWQVRGHRSITAALMHLPWWLSAVVTAALLIPGPQDEAFVALVIAGVALFKPQMRRDVRWAWGSIYSREGYILDAR